jgi:hypothetical protein
MRFLCLCYYDHPKFEAMTPEDGAEIEAACKPHDAALRATGKVLLTGSLGLPSATRTLRPAADGSEPTVTEGLYAPTNEPVGAFFIVEAQDVDEAVAIASKHPGAHLGRFFGGGIEVRPIDFYE